MTSIADILAGIAALLSDYSAAVDYIPDVDRPGEDLTTRHVYVTPSEFGADPASRNGAAENLSVDVAVLHKCAEADFASRCDDVRSIARKLVGKAVAGPWYVNRCESNPLYVPHYWQESGLFAGAVRVELIARTSDDDDGEGEGS